MTAIALALCFPISLAEAQEAGAPSGSNLALPDGEKISLAHAANSADPESRFSALVDNYFDSAFKRDPSWATDLGFHQYDGMAPDMTASAFADEIAELKKQQSSFVALSADSLSRQSKIDLALINSQIKSRLLSLEEMKDWQRNPDEYSSAVNVLIFTLMKRNFAPLAERLKSVIAREQRIKNILAAGKKNVHNPPRIYTQIAIEQMPGIISFFEHSVPECFKSVENKELQEQFQKSNQEAITQLRDYENYLKTVLLPKSNGSFPIGPDFYAKKLLYDQMVEIPIDQLLSSGYEELKRLQREFANTTKEINPDKPVAEVMKEVSLDHPSPDKLISSTASVLDKLKSFCIEHNIVTIPAQTNLNVAEMPPFKRALSWASMDSPGPFETKASEAYYNVTVPEPDWTPERTEEHMRAFCKYDLLNTSVHEAYPGHYVQGLFNQNAPSKTTKIVGCGSNIEGWAHYCEQMMIEQGLENNDPKLKLIMLHDALLRCCRYIVGISMHTKGMSMEEGIAFFMKEGYQERAGAERETKRGTMSPTYLIYTLGKLQIQALKEDYKRAKGADFSLKDFHDRFLSTGRPPVKIIRQIMLESELSGH
jgi:uncharacterized protein (DUF885 family)